MTLMKTLVRVPLSTYTGYGNDGIGLVQALVRWGCDVYLDPTMVAPPLPEDVAFLLTKRLAPPFDLTISHLDPAALDSPEPMARSTDFLLAWTMWEYTTLTNLPGRSNLRRRLSRFNGLLAYDSVTAGAFRDFSKVPPVAVLQGGFDPTDWPKMSRDWFSDTFGFCMAGQLHSRKDPFVAIDAFRQARDIDPDFAAKARLSLKTTVAGLHKRMEEVYPGVKVYYEVWPKDLLRDFYGAHHVLVAPSRGEGKNMPALEFMATGGTVIATGWGGHAQWLNHDYAYALNYSLAPVSSDYPKAFQARASVAHLRDLMLHTFRHRSEVRDKGDLAAEVIPRMCSWDAVVQRLFESAVKAFSGGDKVADRAAAARREVAPVER